MMTWLRGQAQANEEMWSKPGKGGVQATSAAEEPEEDEEPERGIGIGVATGKASKKDNKARQ